MKIDCQSYNEIPLNNISYKEIIEKKAYEKWESAGKPSNKELYFWLLAEKEIELEFSQYIKNLLY